MTYQGVWDQWELYDIDKDPEQKNNLLGDIKWGHDYGNFQRHVKSQNPELYEVVGELDKRLNDELKKTGGSRTPVFQNLS